MPISLTREHDGRVARVRFDNAGRGNAFDDAALRELVAAMESAAAEPGCAVVRLDMAGRHFCGGWDTSSFAGLGAATTESVAAGLRDSDAQLGRIRDLPVPVVAAVRGRVIGFGAGLLAALHLPIAGRQARLSLPEVRFGFAPAGVGFTIAHRLPRPHAYALLTGVTEATAEQLLGWGLVARVVADDDLEAEVDAVVAGLAAVPGDTLRGVVGVVEASLATGSPERAYQISAATITSGELRA
ncbi:enoyl-CoA hydratase/isomerase family protein [Dactylosporangium sp. CS-047395]|uniref:enoyl-CoA hydratase/isomerase family protein n=1 Tax=Dactylosporangium sp. CS-047395 TaxID=3239936 RepID=UPI003D8A1389